MVKTEEEYAGLVDTLDLPIEATSTYEKWQVALAEELGYRYSDLTAERTWEGADMLYRQFPEAGFTYRRAEMKWGYQGQFISVDPAITGRRAGTILPMELVSNLLKGLR